MDYVKEEIVKIYSDFKRINDVLPFKIGLEETICKYFKCVLNIQNIQSEINYKNDILGGPTGPMGPRAPLPLF